MVSAVAYDAAMLATRTAVIGRVGAIFDGLPDYRDGNMTRFVDMVVPVVQAGQARTGQLTAAYFGTSIAASEALTERRGTPADEVYWRVAKSIYYALSLGSAVYDSVLQGRKRAVDLASTDLQLAKTSQIDWSMSQRGTGFYRRVLTGRENCALCVIASTQRYNVGNLMPIHPGCVPGDSILSPVAGGSAKLADFAWGEVEAVSRRMFEGELVEFVTASGDKVRVTANHPVLTDRGWVPAHLMSEGDTVFRGGSHERVVGGGPDVDERPAFAEDVFDAARVAFPLVRVPLAAEDFHADAADGEVEIVYTHGNFPTPGGADLVQRLSERGFVHAHGGRVAFDGSGALGSFVPGGFAASRGGVGGGGLGGDLFGRHLGGSGEASGTPVARFDAPSEEFSFESAAAYAGQGLDLVRRLSGRVEGDRVVELRRFSWSGHVFNLHTREGWYASNNHIVSNCDCNAEEIRGDRAPSKVVDQQLLDDTHDAIAAKLGRSEFSARDLARGKQDAKGRDLSDYTDLIITREHGEIGPLLAWRSDKFTSASDLNI